MNFVGYAGGGRAILCLLLVAGFCLLAEPGWSKEPETWDFDIPSQPVQNALGVLAQQTGTQLLFPYDKVTGPRSNALSGRHTLVEALARMLRGTGLSGDITSSGVITISLDQVAGDGGENMSGRTGKRNHSIAAALLSVWIKPFNGGSAIA